MLVYKRVWAVLSLSIILAMLLAACGQETVEVTRVVTPGRR